MVDENIFGGIFFGFFPLNQGILRENLLEK
jgi:hypothetical protein